MERKANTQIGIAIFGQLSSTKYATGILIDYRQEKNLFYLGPKIPIPLNDVEGIGLCLGYGRQLIGNEKLKVYLIPDIQWLSSKTPNQIKPTHYFDWTLNYSLAYLKINKFALSSSFGYGLFLKRYYKNDTQKMESSSGLSGLIRVSIIYFFVQKNRCADCPNLK